MGRFDKTIIPLALVGYEKIIVSSAIRTSLAIHHSVGDPHLELGGGGGGVCGSILLVLPAFLPPVISSFLPKIRWGVGVGGLCPLGSSSSSATAISP